MRTSILFTVIAAGLVFGAGARGLWQAATKPDRATAYIALFDQHCRPRIAAHAARKDAYNTLNNKDEKQFIDSTSDLKITQTRHRCTISEARQLMSAPARERVSQQLAEYIAATLPALRYRADPIPSFDLYQADLAQPPGLANNGQWGVIHLRVEGGSGTLTQLTRTQLVLPYTNAPQARKSDSRG